MLDARHLCDWIVTQLAIFSFITVVSFRLEGIKVINKTKKKYSFLHESTKDDWIVTYFSQTCLENKKMLIKDASGKPCLVIFILVRA